MVRAVPLSACVLRTPYFWWVVPNRLGAVDHQRKAQGGERKRAAPMRVREHMCAITLKLTWHGHPAPCWCADVDQGCHQELCE
jgi:hypothetical protein